VLGGLPETTLRQSRKNKKPGTNGHEKDQRALLQNKVQTTPLWGGGKHKSKKPGIGENFITGGEWGGTTGSEVGTESPKFKFGRPGG